VSEFNRQHILQNYPGMVSSQVLVHRIGIDPLRWRPVRSFWRKHESVVLSVGRLHPVKNHVFLIQACHSLRKTGVRFRCLIAGDGEERTKLERLIRRLDLQNQVTLLRHVPREQLPALYSRADVVVLTSSSEGIPLTLMEAMAMEKLVLAPAITGIPELITEGETGFLYPSCSGEEFVKKLQFLIHAGNSLDRMRRAARKKIERDFNSAPNLRAFARDFLDHITAIPVRDSAAAETQIDANSLLQQI
jgi:glycosyltransferase involved in cell wall biosynthesis